MGSSRRATGGGRVRARAIETGDAKAELAACLELGQDLLRVEIGDGYILASTEADLVLTRFADQAGAPPLRVGYRLRDGTVEYLLWPQGLDGGPPAAAHAVLANVAEMRLSALREDGAWLPVWPAGQPLPRAVAVELALVSGERVTRLFPLK